MEVYVNFCVSIDYFGSILEISIMVTVVKVIGEISQNDDDFKILVLKVA